MNATETARALPRLNWTTSFLWIAGVLILVINGVSLYHNLQSLKSANTLMSQSARVHDRLQSLNVAVMDAENSQRGYFISGSPLYLGPRRAAPANIAQTLDELQALLADNPSQSKNLSQLRPLVQRRIAAMDESMDLYAQGGLDAIVKRAQDLDNRNAMDEIRLMIVMMEQEQSELLTSRSAAFYLEYQKAVGLGIGINLMAILVLTLFYHLVRRSFYVRVEAEQALHAANGNLESMVAQRTEQLSVLSRHLINVREEEKTKLARELHDEMGANLTTISMDLSAVTERLQSDQQELAGMLQRARSTLLDTMELKRRIVENLRPSLLDNLGLSAAIQNYCAEVASVSGLDCATDIRGPVERATASQAIALFRIVQESLNNILKYAQARHAFVRLHCREDGISLCVDDDGIGIAPDALDKPKSHGLLGMRERALLLGGKLHVGGGPGGQGTRVEVWMPLAPPPTEADAASAALHRSADDPTPASSPDSTRPHTTPDLDDQLH